MASSLILKRFVHPAAMSPSASRFLQTKPTGKFYSILESSFRPPGVGFKETEDSMNIWVDLPGLSIEEVKSTVYRNILFIQVEGCKDSDHEGIGRKYSGGLELPPEGVKIVLPKNGMLKIVLPKK